MVTFSSKYLMKNETLSMKMNISFFKYIILKASKTTNMIYLSVVFFIQGASKIRY